GTKPGWTGADDGHFLAGTNCGGLRNDPALFPALVDDGALEVFYGYRRGVDAQGTGTFARSRTNPARKIREIIGLTPPLEGFFPQAAIHEVIPFGNEVVNRAAGGHTVEQSPRMAEGNAAIHAPGALFTELFLLHVKVEFIPIANALDGRAV